jgi:hypothetical protein
VRSETRTERDQWTALVEGNTVLRNKYGAQRSGKYPSKHEAATAVNLAALASCGKITELKEQVSYTLVEGQGKIRPIRYIADFVFRDANGVLHVCDAKGYAKNPVYRLKKKLMRLLHGITIEEL